MYLVPIQVPIYLDGDRKFVTTEWHRELILLRDSFAGRFGDITVAAPSLPANAVTLEQHLTEIPENTPGLKLKASFDKRCRARHFWLHERKRWRADLAELAPTAEVVHAGLDDVYRHIAFEGFRMGVRLGIPTVFVQDTDNVVQQRQIFKSHGAVQRAKVEAYIWIYERLCRWGVAHADLAMLKGSTLMARYGPHAKNAKEFHETSYSLTEIVPPQALEQRIATLSQVRALKLVYCGRLIARKGIDRSLQMLAAARAAGADFEFDIFGDGPDRKRLESIAQSAGVTPFVRFHGSLPYDASLLARLATYDAMLFTPIAEDTPRMIFDGYAAGLPLLAFDIGYVRERSTNEHATQLMPLEKVPESAEILVSLFRDRSRLAELARASRAAGEMHAAEHWYKRRADWTIEAVERKRREKTGGTAVTMGRAA